MDRNDRRMVSILAPAVIASCSKENNNRLRVVVLPHRVTLALVSHSRLNSRISKNATSTSSTSLGLLLLSIFNLVCRNIVIVQENIFIFGCCMFMPILRLTWDDLYAVFLFLRQRIQLRVKKR